MLTVNRRGLLTGLAATGAMAMISSPAAAAQRKGFFERIGRPIGLQLYTLGEEAGRDLDTTFAQVAAIGYRDIELPNLYGRTPRDIRAAADRSGLSISSLHLPGMSRGQPAGLSLVSAPAEIADALGALGAKRTVMPIALFPENFRPQAGENMQTIIARAFATAGADVWKRTAALLNERATALKPLGVSVGYHNHNLEFAPIGKTNGWQILVKETDPALVTFETDIGWVAAAGVEPMRFLEQHRGRIEQLHVKDIARNNTPNFALTMQPAEIGYGALDWARILPAAFKAGVQHFYVEQEPPFTIPRIEAARKSYAYLSQLRA
jgi:sugar phosphate isomerase/epimerase